MEILAIVELRDNNPILYPLLVLSLKDTRLHIAQQLGLSRGQLRQETKGEGHCFVQHLLSHQENYQIQGGTWETVFCLKDAKTEFCSNDKCHSLELLTMIKSVSETESKLRESDHPHSLKVSKMANDIMAKCEALEKKPKRVH